MLIILLILSILLFIVAVAIDDGLGLIPFGMFCVFGVCIIAMIVCTANIVRGRVIDAEIELYTEENNKIETAIDELVKNYMEFESETFSNLKNDSAITLVSLYPELKSDELVKTQIDTYQENNREIKALKEKKLKISVYKWWLYFGK